MPATTPKGYPYPLGSDRVMDGDDSIKALAEAIEADANYTLAKATGQSLTAAVAASVNWNAASPNGCGLTKTSAYQWTVTKAGLYVISANVQVNAFQDPVGTRAYTYMLAGWYQSRAAWSGENQGAAHLVAALVPGDVISVSVFVTDATSITSTSTSYLSVARLGRYVP